MPASLVAVTVAQDVLLSNQFPPLYDAASGDPITSHSHPVWLASFGWS